jgi:LysM repeat protein
VRAPAGWRRFAGPAAFLLAATVVVVVIHSGLESGHSTTTTTTRTTTTVVKPAHPKRTGSRRYWTVQAGDTFALISRKSGVPVATIERLNPNASSTSLTIGEKLRLR